MAQLLEMSSLNLTDLGLSLKQIAGLGSATVDFVAVPYPGEIPATALASFPRSGSSFTRSLVERATGWY